MESGPKKPIVPDEEGKDVPVRNRRSFLLRGIGMAAAAGLAGAVGSAAERKIGSMLEGKDISSGAPIDPLQQQAGERDARFYEALQSGEPESVALATELINYYDTELKGLLSVYSELNNRLTKSKWGSASRDMLENEILTNTQRQEWVKGQIRLFKDPIDFHIQNQSVPPGESPPSPKKKIFHM
ncbi:MAG: hypothetical protein AAB882_01915 [Patescibacteria group bacterium]